MTQSTNASGKNSIGGILAFVLIVGGLTGFNWWRAGSKVQESCKTELADVMNDEACACFAGKVRAKYGIPGFLPVVGRFLRPSDEKIAEMSTQSMLQCMGESAA